MKKSRLWKRRRIIMGYVLFFLSITVTIMFSVLIFDAVSNKSGQSNTVISLVMIVVIVAFAALATLADMLRRKIMVEKPVEKILDATRKLCGGDFSVRIEPLHPYESYDEYDIIMDDINMLAAQLSKTEVLRTDFIANVSHEIKTPLSVIQNYATAIQHESISSETRREYAKTLVTAAQRLTSLVTNILKLNKLENQEIFPEIERIDIGACLGECVLQFENLIENKELELRCDIDDITARSDRNLLEIVLNNLLSNAIKFTPNGGSIGVSLKGGGANIIICVSDSGCGMSAETGSHIFDKFYQGDTSHSHEGNGLGLALVKKVVDILGGEISVQSAVGKGSTFTVRLRNDEEGQ